MRQILWRHLDCSLGERILISNVTLVLLKKICSLGPRLTYWGDFPFWGGKSPGGSFPGSSYSSRRDHSRRSGRSQSSSQHWPGGAAGTADGQTLSYDLGRVWSWDGQWRTEVLLLPALVRPSRGATVNQTTETRATETTAFKKEAPTSSQVWA